MNVRLGQDARAVAHGHAFVDDAEDDEGALQEEQGEVFAGKIPTVFFVAALAHQNAARRREETTAWTHILTCACLLDAGLNDPCAGQ